jgi:acetyl/propionyl-CoA carboxylase alpha subunit
LVANRGEIAVRVIQTLQEMGIAAVALYSDVDRDAPYVRLADEARPLGGAAAAETYLSIEKILDAARASGAEAVHPGYGFLSENAGFAEALEQAGIKLIGPPARVIHAMGDKIESRRRMAAAGVPIVPGWEGEIGAPQAMRRVAKEIGYPLLVKAAAGGGGKGMRRVDEPSELDGAIESARREAERAFGDPRVYLEKYLTRPRHVEIQIFGDAHGNVVHLFERECSIQRRHQKIIEESPSPALDDTLRRRISEAAVQAARAIGYENAGTVEFILDAGAAEAKRCRGEEVKKTGPDPALTSSAPGPCPFYFLEVNTRLQVEHPVTELVTGRDLVRAQIAVAAGEALPFRQEEIRQNGHAIECRVYAEDPENAFLPSTGTIQVYREPAGPGIRVDSGVEQGSEVTVHYDPLLAKLIVWAHDRDAALAKMDWALSHFVILGVRTNLSFLRGVIRHPSFQAGDLHTHFLQEHPVPTTSPTPPLEALAAAALALRGRADERRMTNDQRQGTEAASPWLDAGHWRLR